MTIKYLNIHCYAFFILSLVKKLEMKIDIIAARYPEIFRNGGSIKGRTRIIFNEGFIFSKLKINRGTYQNKPIIHDIGFIIFIQFIIVKKHKFIEYFEYLKRQIKAPIVPKIPLKYKLLESRGLANPKTKKCE